jgi:hypothetical protein
MPSHDRLIGSLKTVDSFLPSPKLGFLRRRNGELYSLGDSIGGKRKPLSGPIFNVKAIPGLTWVRFDGKIRDGRHSVA